MVAEVLKMTPRMLQLVAVRLDVQKKDRLAPLACAVVVDHDFGKSLDVDHEHYPKMDGQSIWHHQIWQCADLIENETLAH